MMDNLKKNLLSKISKKTNSEGHASALTSSNGFVMKNEGFCYCCDQKVTFSSQNSWLRDHYLCSNCGSIPRERALMYCIDTFYPEWRKAFIHESSPCNRGASLRLKHNCMHYIASQFFPGIPLGKNVEEFRNENLEKQSFEDECFDLVITQDVMEHIFEPGRAFAEIARTLKKGGAHIFTVPLVNKNRPTEIWAERDKAGAINYIGTPEYHGNPVDDEGSLVTMHWGYDISDYILKHSGLYTTIVFIDNIDLGIRAELIEVAISRKF
jgi:SAM-dependent methyltransferase